MTKYKINGLDLDNLVVDLTEIVPPPEPTPTGALTYLGKFAAPSHDGSGIGGEGHTYNFGGDAFDVIADTMWLSSHDKMRWVGQCRLPELLVKHAHTPPPATPMSTCIDLQGDLDEQGGGGRMPLRSIVADPALNSIRWVGPHYYNVDQTPYDSLGVTSMDGRNRNGPFGIVVDGRQMPDQHFGRGICEPTGEGGVLALGGGLPGQGTTGIGPTLYSFDWGELDANNDFPADQLLYYPEEHPFPGWNPACRPADLVVVGDEVWIACLMASGEIWYGGNTSPNGVVDSYNRHKSYHAETYEWKWAKYTWEMLNAVANSELETWQITPRMGSFPSEVPLGSSNMGIRLSLDGDRLYVLQKWAYRPDGLHLPLIHVYEVL